MAHGGNGNGGHGGGMHHHGGHGEGGLLGLWAFCMAFPGLSRFIILFVILWLLH